MALSELAIGVVQTQMSRARSRHWEPDLDRGSRCGVELPDCDPVSQALSFSTYTELPKHHHVGLNFSVEPFNPWFWSPLLHQVHHRCFQSSHTKCKSVVSKSQSMLTSFSENVFRRTTINTFSLISQFSKILRTKQFFEYLTKRPLKFWIWGVDCWRVWRERGSKENYHSLRMVI